MSRRYHFLNTETTNSQKCFSCEHIHFMCKGGDYILVAIDYANAVFQNYYYWRQFREGDLFCKTLNSRIDANKSLFYSQNFLCETINGWICLWSNNPLSTFLRHVTFNEMNFIGGNKVYSHVTKPFPWRKI